MHGADVPHTLLSSAEETAHSACDQLGLLTEAIKTVQRTLVADGLPMIANRLRWLCFRPGRQSGYATTAVAN